jgi:protein-S-isoprenylcysteine O-methyltransferase Ste14
MYLGHLIFTLGRAITFNSRLALGILILNAYWFHQRVLEDERALKTRFGPDYLAHTAEVKRWICGLP